MRNFHTLLVFLLLGVACGDAWRLIWQDNFDRLDGHKWEHEVSAWGGGNEEFQVYLPDKRNVYTKDGVLHIEPTLLKDSTNPKTGNPFGEQFLWTGVLDLKELYGKCTMAENWGCRRDNGMVPPIASGRIRTKGKFSFKYGKMEFRAKMAGGDWHWPAIWLLPESWVYGGWPVSGEVDVVEVLGNRDFKYQDGPHKGNPIGQQLAGVALHWGVDPSQNKVWKTAIKKTNTTDTFAGSFHLYKMEWTENGFSFYIDNELVMRRPEPSIDQNPNWKGFYEFGKPWNGGHNPWATGGPMAPFDQNFHILMNVAVGGRSAFIPDNGINQGGRFPKPWRNNMSWREAKDMFYARRNDWLWTWEKPSSSMQIDYIRVYQK